MNPSASKVVVKNATIMLLSQFITWALSFVLLIVMAQKLGDARVGILHLATSIWAIALAFITFGMDLLLTKEIARHPEKTSQLVGTTMLIRFPLYIISYAAVALYVNFVPANYSAEIIQIVYLIGIGHLFWAMTSSFSASLQGLEKMVYISAGDIISKLFNTVTILTLLFMGYGLYAIAIVNIVMAIISFLVQGYALNRFHKISFTFDYALAKSMLRGGVPYFMTGLFLVLYIQMDVIVISWFVNEETIGWYSQADKLFGTLLFIPSVFITAIFPALSRMFTNRSDSLHLMMRKSFNMLMLLSIPIGMGLIVLGTPIAVTLFEEKFRNSGPILSILGIVLMIMYQNILIGRFLISMDRQNEWTRIMAFATLGTFVLDMLLIPWTHRAFGNGGIGGALSYVVTEGTMLIIGLRMLPKGALDISNISTAIRVVSAGLLMSVAVWLLRDAWLGFPILAGVAIYPILIYLFRAIPAEDIRLISQIIPLKRLRRTAVPSPSE